MLAAIAEDPAEPVELDFAHHVLLTGVRALIVGRGDCVVVRRAFGELCGPRADQMLGTLYLVVKLLAFASRRRLRVHLPGCSAVSQDELMLLSAFTEAQGWAPHPAGRRAPQAGSWIERLTGAERDRALDAAMADLADLLALSGRRLERLDLDCNPDAAEPARRTLH
jgi:hypothetical protein